MNRKIGFVSFIVAVFMLQQVTAQVTINIKSQAAYTAYYAVSYSTNGISTSMPEKTIFAGGNQTVSLPAGSTNISIKTRFKSVFADYDLTTVNANRSGGTFTFKGLLGSTDFSWEPDDATSGMGEQNFANINTIYPNGDAELHRVAREFNAIQMQALIDKGTTHINTKNARGFTPLHEAVQSGFGSGIDILLKAGADMSSQNSMGETPFVMALGLGKKELAQKFIDNGYAASADTKALETVVKKRNEDMVKFMLTNGADPNTTMNLAIQQNNFQLVEMLMNNYAPTVTIDLFQKATDARRFDLAKKVLQEANIDANQAMDYAILKNVPELVQASMEKGADANKALKFAVANRKPDIAGAAISTYGANANNALDDAIRSNQTDVISLLLDNNADPNIGLTAALNNNKINLIPLMIGKGAKVSSEQMSKVAATGDNALIKNLIEAGGDKNAALAGAMAAKKYQSAELIIQAGATPDNIIKPAVENKQKNLMIAALDAGADANPGLAPAINAGLADYAELLFKGGAKTNDVNLVNTVISKRDINLLKLILANQTSPDLGMPVAVSSNNTEAVQLLLANSADAKAAPLIAAAAKNKNVAMIDLLVKAGADPSNGITEAVKAGDVATTKYLIGAGANGNNVQLMNYSVAKNNGDLTALFVDAGASPGAAVQTAVDYNASNVLAMLIAKGADVKNPVYLLTAVKKNNLANVNLLLAAGADVNYKNELGNNLLHIAADAEADAVVAALVAAGVKVNDVNNAKDAPIHIAVTQGRGEVKLVEVFIAAGADVNMLNGAGKKPLDITKGSRIKNRLKDAGATKTDN